MSNGKLKIEEWHPESPSQAATVSQGIRWSPSHRVVGFAGTLLLHLLAFQSIVLGTQAHKTRPPEVQGLGSVLIKSDHAPSETLILLDTPQASMSDKPLTEDLVSLGVPAKADLIALLSPDALPHIDIPTVVLDDDPSADAAIDSGDPNSRAVLFSRYTGQIDARIERAWQRPRSPVKFHDNASQHSGQTSTNGVPGDDVFKCQVRIVQDRSGSVQEVQMLSCKGSVAWQQSLVSAIFSVSPLPAPPNPTVFTKAVTMTFSAEPYRQGSAPEGYELERPMVSRFEHRGRGQEAPAYARTSNPAGILFSRPTP